MCHLFESSFLRGDFPFSTQHFHSCYFSEQELRWPLALGHVHSREPFGLSALLNAGWLSLPVCARQPAPASLLPPGTHLQRLWALKAHSPQGPAHAREPRPCLTHISCRAPPKYTGQRRQQLEGWERLGGCVVCGVKVCHRPEATASIAQRSGGARRPWTWTLNGEAILDSQTRSQPRVPKIATA